MAAQNTIAMAYGGYRRHQEMTTANERPIIRSSTPTLGTWFWVGIETTDGTWVPMGRKCFDTAREAAEYSDAR